MLWTVFLFPGIPILRRLWQFVWVFLEKYLFPFNLISGYWKISSPWRYPTNDRADSMRALCAKCKRFTTKSNLNLGSNYPLVRLVEWHKFWDSFEELQHSVLKVGSPCHLCSLLWHSISENRRKEIIFGRHWLLGHRARKTQQPSSQDWWVFYLGQHS